MNFDVLVIGGGPAGLAAAAEARRCGIEKIAVIERDRFAGGILNQCIHDGFGVIRFGETLTGPEYAYRFEAELKKLDVPVFYGAMVVDFNSDSKLELAISEKGSYRRINSKAVILAMGCRERTRGALGIAGTRPAGIFTAGVAQNMMNLKNIRIGRNVVILGSGDIGLIMARRLTLEGAKVIAVIEKLPYPSGLQRNLTQCLEDFSIPLLLKHTITKIRGRDRIESVTVSPVDENGKIIQKGSFVIRCDTLILSVGLIPENEVAKKAGVAIDSITGGPIVDENLETSISGVFSCGNSLHVHDLVDYVSEEAETAGKAAAEFVLNNDNEQCPILVKPGNGLRYVLPNFISGKKSVLFSMRVNAPFRDCNLVFCSGKKEILRKKFKQMNPAEMIRITLPCPNSPFDSPITVFVE